VKLLFFFFALSGFRADPASGEPPVAVTAADTGRTITLRIGQELIVNLESNRSTGYSWSLAKAPALVLISLGQPVYQSDRSLPGAGGLESWRFRASVAGEQTLTLTYRRPWEKDIAPARAVEFRIKVL
jgi:inhibitor of cysteine peptidase